MDDWLAQSLHPGNVSLVARAASELARQSPFEPLDALSAESCAKRELTAATLEALTTRPINLEDLRAINEVAAKSTAQVLLFGEAPREQADLVQAAHETSRQARIAKTEDAFKNQHEERKMRREEELVLRRAAGEASISLAKKEQRDNRM